MEGTPPVTTYSCGRCACRPGTLDVHLSSSMQCLRDGSRTLPPSRVFQRTGGSHHSDVLPVRSRIGQPEYSQFFIFARFWGGSCKLPRGRALRRLVGSAVGFGERATWRIHNSSTLQCFVDSCLRVEFFGGGVAHGSPAVAVTDREVRKFTILQLCNVLGARASYLGVELFVRRLVGSAAAFDKRATWIFTIPNFAMFWGLPPPNSNSSVRSMPHGRGGQRPGGLRNSQFFNFAMFGAGLC